MADTPTPSPVRDLATMGQDPSGRAEALLNQAMGETVGQDGSRAGYKGGTAARQYEYQGDPNVVAPLDETTATSVESGASGTVVPNGFIVNEEYNAALQGREGLIKFDEMRKSDATVRWSLQVIKLPIRAAKFRIEPASDSARDQQIADQVKWNLFERLEWQDMLREMLTYLDFGFYLGEKVFVAEDYKGKPAIVLRRLASRKQSTIFRWEQGDGAPGVTQVTYQGTFNIPENRLFLLTHEREGNNYAGVSLLRGAYKHWYIKDNLYKIAALTAERQGLGVLKIKHLQKPNPEERKDATAAAQNLRANELGYIEESPNVDIGFMDMMAHTVVDSSPEVEHHNRQILMNVGAAFMEMGGHKGSGGTQSASGDQSEVYEMAVEAYANEIETAINRMLIRPLVDLNFTGVTDYPRLMHDKIGQDDLQTYGRGVALLTQADLITPDPDLEEALRERYSLPELPDDIKKDYKNRDRSQADTVPVYAPAVPPGGTPAPAPGTPNPGAKPQPTPQPGKPPAKPTVKAGELIGRVKRVYAEIGDELDALADDPGA